MPFRFEPGQFAWFAIGRSPFSLTRHPFSFSSSAEGDEVEVAVKALGDFTSRVGELEPGTTVYVDGPHGVFSIDRDEGPGFALIAGGVGIAGLISMLRTKQRIDLTLIRVLERPPEDWEGETGYVTAELLARHLPVPPERVHTERFDMV